MAFAVVACSDTPKPESELVRAAATARQRRARRAISPSTSATSSISRPTASICRPRPQQTLTNQARWLQQYAQYTITIEGHADERGTREYNIALGAKRAQTVRNFLAQHGINAQRIRTISYGKERPVAVCNDISCWSQNRRAQTVLNSRHEARS